MQARQLAADWLKVSGRDQQGVNTRAYLWHVFSGNRFPSVSGQDALLHYRQQVSDSFIALGNDCKLAFVTDLLPQQSSLADYYVFPKNFAWTMAFTHEEGWCGPYFARHPDYARLDAENQSKLRKRHQAEAARQKGWA